MKLLSREHYIWVFIAAIAVKILVSIHSHSGQGHPPLFGDFEAQRHWLEVTLNLDIGDWYRQTDKNDLLYWGLDYPPLTAYVSLFFAKLAEISGNFEIVQWHLSRGKEDLQARLFMRLSVIACDILIYIPSAIYCANIIYREILKFHGIVSNHGDNQQTFSLLYLFVCLCCPGLLLIDHGHFQYNGVCIGFAIAGAAAICSNNKSWLQDILGSILFCLSLNFKQMSLYYSPVFFFALLYRCGQQETIWKKFIKLAAIGSTVIVTFAILWFPFCIYHAETETCGSSLLHVLQRQFPFNRGIFEDKVANVWYTISVVIDIRDYISIPNLVKLSLLGTIVSLLPICSYLCLYRLNGTRFILSLIGSSLAFFLFSFQVHEKSILLSVVPASFLLPYDWEFIRWFQLLAIFTMWPLLKRDNLQLPTFACSLFYYGMVDILRVLRGPSEQIKDQQSQPPPEHRNNMLVRFINISNISCETIISKWQSHHRIVRSILHHFIKVSYAVMIILLVLEFTITPPSKYPDLFPALNAIFGACNFVVIFIYFVFWLWISKDTIDLADVSSKKID